MDLENELKLMLQEAGVSNFKPCVEHHKEADALSVYFKPDADYSKRLTDHVTLFLSLDTNEIVGCRIKGIAGILADLPNFIHIDHDDVRLSLLFWSFRGSASDESVKNALRELAENAKDMTVSNVLSA